MYIVYKVYSDDVLIHDSSSPSKYGHLISPTLSLSDNSAGSFSATIPPTNIGYREVKRLTSTIIVKKNDSIIWTGRVISESIDFYNQRKITCEGALAFLNDINQGLHYYGSSNPATFLNTILNIHNAAVTNEKRKIFLGTITMNDSELSYEYQTNYGSTLEEIQNNCLSRLGGHMTIQYDNNGNAKLYYYSDFVNTAAQTIDFGKNLLDFTRNWSINNLATVIYPRGKQLDEETETGQKAYVTIDQASDNVNPSHANCLINEEAYNTWGRLEQVVDFSDCENPDILYNLGLAYLESLQFDEIVLTVKVLDLYNLVKGNPHFNFFDLVHCKSSIHGLDKDFPIVEVSIPLDNLENTIYTMSYTTKTQSLTNSISAKHTDSMQSISSLITNNRILEMTKEQTAEMLHRKTTGYVNVVNMYDDDEEGVAEAIVISDRLNWTSSEARYWIWNMNGLGYTSDGGRTVEAAITMDGTIVANWIKTGVLSDEMGYNAWNLETGEFRLQPNTQLYYGSTASDYKSVFDLIYDTDKAVNKRTGSANYLNGTKDWANWRTSGTWTIEEEEAINAASARSTWNDVLKSPERGIAYATIKGYRMAFSIEGSSDDIWGPISIDNAFVVSFSLVNSSGTRIAHCDKAFSFNTDYSRRFTTIDLVDDTFTRDTSGSYDTCYIDIWLYNKSLHSIAIRRPQFERGNSPTDWSISDWDIDQEAQNKATQAYNNAIDVSSRMDATVQTNAVNEAQRLAGIALTNSKNYTDIISENDRKYSDEVLKAFDLSLTQRETLRRLTNNFTNSGIYLNNGELLINADFIRTGSLDAGIITAGVITDVYHNHKWDLTKGYFESTNAHFYNADVEGAVTAGDNNNGRVLLANGAATFYWGNRFAGEIHAENSNAAWLRIVGDFIDIRANSQIHIESRNITITDDSDWFDEYSIIESIWENREEGIIEWQPRQLRVWKNDAIGVYNIEIF